MCLEATQDTGLSQKATSPARWKQGCGVQIETIGEQATNLNLYPQQQNINQNT
jgi:hypothetical protein